MFKILGLTIFYLIPLEAWQYALSYRQSSYCTGQEFGEFVANPEDCKLFYLCGENGVDVLATCPLNMLFNPQTKLCDNPSNVQCATIQTTAKPFHIASTPGTAPPALITIDNKPARVESYCFNYYAKQTNTNVLVFMPHPRNCQQYYMCYQGQALLQACNEQMHWNTKLNKCDLPSQAGCLGQHLEAATDEDIEIFPSLDTHFEGNGIKCPLHGEHIFPNTKRCNTFIYCIKGQAVLQICPFYQHFDVNSGRCEWISKSTCVKDLNLM